VAFKPDAIAQDGAIRIRATRINSDNPHLVAPCSQVTD
jgi:hypothetical protein